MSNSGENMQLAEGSTGASEDQPPRNPRDSSCDERRSPASVLGTDHSRISVSELWRIAAEQSRSEQAASAAEPPVEGT